MDWLFTFILVSLSSAIAVLYAVPALSSRLSRAGRVDVPNARSAHKVPTPSMGGLTFILGLLICVLLIPDVELLITCLLIASAGALGFADDILDISPKLKLLSQAMIAFGLVQSGISINPLFQMLFGVELSFWMDALLTIFFISGIVNSFNLLDGADGLLAGVAIVSSVVLAICFYRNGNMPFLGLSLAMIAVLLAFLTYNFHPATIFMGDTGSLLIGTYIAVSVLKITEAGTSETSLLAIACVLFSALDMSRLFLGRFLISRKPFQADRNHFHHVLVRVKWDHRRIMLFAIILQIGLVLTAYFASAKISFLATFLTMMFVSFTYMGLLHFLEFRRRINHYRFLKERHQMEVINNQLLNTYLDEDEMHIYN